MFTTRRSTTGSPEVVAAAFGGGRGVTRSSSAGNTTPLLLNLNDESNWIVPDEDSAILGSSGDHEERSESLDDDSSVVYCGVNAMEYRAVGANRNTNGDVDDITRTNNAFLTIPLAEAVPIEPLPRTACSMRRKQLKCGAIRTVQCCPGALVDTCNQQCNVETGVAHPVGYSRPQFLYVRVIKPFGKKSVGLFFKKEKGKQICITRVSEDGLFAGSKLRPGDEIIAVNNVSCLNKSGKQVVMLLQRTEGYCSIIVHNKSGDPNLVSTSIQKATQSEKVGVAFKRNAGGALIISRVDAGGLLDGTLLMAGHRCVSINGTRVTNSSREAANLVVEAAGHVHIVTRAKQDGTAMVLGCEQHKEWWTRMAMGVGVAATTALAAMEIMT